MYNFVQHRRVYYLISSLIILVGVVVMVYATVTTGEPLQLGIDFTGGVYWEFETAQPVDRTALQDALQIAGYGDSPVTTVGSEGNRFQIRLGAIDQDAKEQLEANLETQFGQLNTLQFRNVGPSVGAEVTRTAFFAVLAASIAILGFIVFAFRNIPNSVRYGVSAIAAMVHDVLITLTFVSIMGLVAGWRLDALFLTALLTVIGFSVQDTIVVFDRIRENTSRHRGEDFETITNRSLLETIHRSLTTQLNAFFIMIAILLFGGDTIKPFIGTMLVGMISGTYSSIFVAVPLLVSWEMGDIGRFFGRSRKQRAAAA